MAKLVFKKWYQKSNWARNEKMETITSMKVEDFNTLIVGQTEKALCCVHISCGHKTIVRKMFFPKAALCVIENEEEYNEKNLVENKEKALEEVNEFLKNYTFATQKDISEAIRDCRD